MNIYDIKRDSDAKDQWFTMTSKIRVPVKVAGNSYYLPAMSNAGLFKGYVIDPGSVGYDDFGEDNVHSVLITHGHNDHFRHAHEFRGRGARVIASAGMDSSLVSVCSGTPWFKHPQVSVNNATIKIMMKIL